MIGLLSGVLSGGQIPSMSALLLMGAWWLLPANFFVYGVNDLHDYATDILNPKKRDREAYLPLSAHHAVKKALYAMLGIALVLCCLFPAGWWAMALFLFLGWSYSAPPLRWKGRPLFDMLANSLYCTPALHGFALTGALNLQWQFLLAGVLWCMSMHVFSAIPDIAYDTSAKVRTTATVLGKSTTLLLCIVLYGSAALLLGSWSPVLTLVGCIYVLFPLLVLRGKALDKVYWMFPWVNLAMGALLTCSLLWQLMVY